MGRVLRYPGTFRRLTSEVSRATEILLNAGGQAVTWETIAGNDLGAAPAVNGTRLTAPANGAYWLTAYGHLRSSVNVCDMWLLLNGATTIARITQENTNRPDSTLALGRARRLVAGDFVELWVLAGGGVARHFSYGAASMVRVG